MKTPLILLGAALVSASSYAQISISDFSVGYVEDFNSLSTNTTATSLVSAGGGAFNTTIFPSNTDGQWLFGNSGANAPSYVGGADGLSNSGNFYGFGAGADWSLGSVASGNAASAGSTGGSVFTGLRLLNNTGSSTGLAAIDFALEQYRLGSISTGGTAIDDGFTISYRLYKAGSTPYAIGDIESPTGWSTAGVRYQVASDSTYTTLTPETAGNFLKAPKIQSSTANLTGAAAVLNGNLDENRLNYRLAFQLFSQNLSWDNGDELVIRFADVNVVGNDHGVGIDNLKAVPEPASMAVLGLGILGLARRRRNK